MAVTAPEDVTRVLRALPWALLAPECSTSRPAALRWSTSGAHCRHTAARQYQRLQEHWHPRVLRQAHDQWTRLNSSQFTAGRIMSPNEVVFVGSYPHTRKCREWQASNHRLPGVRRQSEARNGYRVLCGQALLPIAAWGSWTRGPHLRRGPSALRVWCSCIRGDQLVGSDCRRQPERLRDGKEHSWI